jgi:hypothetical protein
MTKTTYIAHPFAGDPIGNMSKVKEIITLKEE